MSDSQVDPDQFTRAGCITQNHYRDVYSTIDPSRPELSQKDRVTIITGAGKGIGRVRTGPISLQTQSRLTSVITPGYRASTRPVRRQGVSPCDSVCSVG